MPALLRGSFCPGLSPIAWQSCVEGRAQASWRAIPGSSLASCGALGWPLCSVSVRLVHHCMAALVLTPVLVLILLAVGLVRAVMLALILLAVACELLSILGSQLS